MTTRESPVVETHITACTLDCPDTCTLAVTVTDGVITDIDAASGNTFTRDWICAKVKRHAQRVYAAERVRTPQVRTGAKGDGSFREASWTEALELIGARMKSAIASAGGDAVVAFTYNSSAGATESDGFTEAFFEAIGATAVDHTICAATASASWRSVFSGMLSADPLDIVHADLVVVWGANPTVSNTHLPPFIEQAAKRGARVVVIDPRRTAMAKRADLHLAVRPGTDVVLALAVANYWAEHNMIDRSFLAQHADGAEEFLAEAAAWSIAEAADVCGLSEADIVTFAEWYGTTKPATLRIGWGQERNANGGASCRAILALPVLANHFGQRGSGVLGSTSRAAAFNTRAAWPALPEVERRHIPMHQIGSWLAPAADDPCQVLFIQGSNPAVMCPDSAAVFAALSRDDVFTVVHEQVMTDTALFADVVLPATTAFEVDDVAISYGSYTAQRVKPVIAPVGESRSNNEVGLALAAQFGWNWAPRSSFDAEPDVNVTAADVLQFVNAFPADGRAHLADAKLGAPRYVPVPAAYPLTLITPASSKLINSMFGEFQSPEPTVALHPTDATARGLTDGETVALVNELGSVTVRLAVSADTRPGVAVVPKGIWRRHFADGWGINRLTPATGDSLVNGACFNDAFVDVVKAVS
jgi:anaerobic selenocysteine-containing dehydrogenase